MWQKDTSCEGCISKVFTGETVCQHSGTGSDSVDILSLGLLCSSSRITWLNALPPLCQVAKILYCFATTFRRVPRKERVTSQGSLVEASDAEQEFTFTVGLEFKEDDSKGNYSTCPKDKNVFKLKVNTEKRLAITVQHTGPQSLRIER